MVTFSDNSHYWIAGSTEKLPPPSYSNLDTELGLENANSLEELNGDQDETETPDILPQEDSEEEVIKEE